MLKLIRCLRRLPGLSLGEFHAHWLEHHARLPLGDRPVRRYVQYHRLPDDPIYKAMMQAEGATAEPYDGVSIQWWDDHRSMADDLAGSPEGQVALGDEQHFVDPAGSTACLTEERVIIEPAGDVPYVLFECLRRRDDMDRAAFQKRWEQHAFIGRQAHRMGLLKGYIQNCALLEDDDRWAATGGDGAAAWDGVVTAYFDSVAKLKALLAAPLGSAEAYEDERTFMDHVRSSYLVARRHVIRDVVR
ncbi:MAG: hypothetical protein GC201_17355 [Alphaproteobacteria bacterium]|nr:hypothetical protein [Alphaproteobacteria bacterium]